MKPESPRISDTVVSPNNTSGWASGCSRATSGSPGSAQSARPAAVRGAAIAGRPRMARLGAGSPGRTGRSLADRRCSRGTGSRKAATAAAAKTNTAKIRTAGAPIPFSRMIPGMAATNPASVPSSVSRAFRTANSSGACSPRRAGPARPDRRLAGLSAR